MRKKDVLFLLFLLAALIAGFVASLGYPYRARFFPLIIISLCGVLVLVELLKAFMLNLKTEPDDQDVNKSEEALNTEKHQPLKFLFTMVWIGVFALMLWLFGFVVGLPLFLLAYVKMHGEKWRWAIMLPAMMFVIVYVGFGLLLKSPLYEGLLFL